MAALPAMKSLLLLMLLLSGVACQGFTPSECLGDFDRRTTAWSDELKEWCCTSQDVGCESEEPSPGLASSAIQREQERTYPGAVHFHHGVFVIMMVICAIVFLFVVAALWIKCMELRHSDGCTTLGKILQPTTMVASMTTLWITLVRSSLGLYSFYVGVYEPFFGESSFLVLWAHGIFYLGPYSVTTFFVLSKVLEVGQSAFAQGACFGGKATPISGVATPENQFDSEMKAFSTLSEDVALTTSNYQRNFELLDLHEEYGVLLKKGDRYYVHAESVDKMFLMPGKVEQQLKEKGLTHGDRVTFQPVYKKYAELPLHGIDLGSLTALRKNEPDCEQLKDCLSLYTSLYASNFLSSKTIHDSHADVAKFVMVGLQVLELMIKVVQAIFAKQPETVTTQAMKLAISKSNANAADAALMSVDNADFLQAMSELGRKSAGGNGAANGAATAGQKTRLAS